MNRFIAIVFLLLVSISCKEAPIDTTQNVEFELGKVAPNFKLKDFNDSLIELNNYKGKVVFLEFWASWCSPCLASMPNLEKTKAEFLNKNFEIISVSLDYTQEDWSNYLKTNYPKWVNVYDLPQNQNILVSQMYGVSYIPFGILIDKNGIARKQIHPGSSELTDEIKLLLNE